MYEQYYMKPASFAYVCNCQAAIKMGVCSAGAYLRCVNKSGLGANPYSSACS